MAAATQEVVEAAQGLRGVAALRIPKRTGTIIQALTCTIMILYARTHGAYTCERHGSPYLPQALQISLARSVCRVSVAYLHDYWRRAFHLLDSNLLIHEPSRMMLKPSTILSVTFSRLWRWCWGLWLRRGGVMRACVEG